ncbi:MAG: ferredoxin [Pseudomonadales bacterium]|nr:ferredoxin [Pseudomonadales bacterium]
MKPAIDLSLCMRTGQCFYLHPGYFKEGADGYPIIIKSLTTESATLKENILDCCPAQAIVFAEQQ